MSGVPEEGVGVEVLGGVEPQPELHLPVSLPLREHIRVQRVRLSGQVPQKLEIYLVVCRPLRRQL